MTDTGTRGRIGVLVLWQSLALLGQAVAVVYARRGAEGFADVLSACSIGLAYLTAVVFLVRPRLSRPLLTAVVASLGLTPALQTRMRDPIVMTGFDEHMHIRTLRDIVLSQDLFIENPYLRASSSYPGMEAAVTLIHQTGIPLAIASLVLMLIARLLLVFVLCDAVAHLSGSLRAGGVAVAVYALTPHFVFWLSQFSYVTFALPVALAAVSLVDRSRRSARPALLLAGATVCLAALAVTHHVTSLVTSAFLAVWALAQSGESRRRVLYAAVAGIACSAVWTAANYGSLRTYLDPVFEDLFGTVSADTLRVPFTSPAARVPGLWERALVFFWAIGLCLLVLWVVVDGIRRAWRRMRTGAPDAVPRTTLMLYVMVAGIPLVIAGRALPLGRLVSDRILDFVLLPLALLFAIVLMRRLRALVDPRRAALAAAIATGIFLGGYLVSNPAWARLPGEYIPSAEIRSIDPETVAAARWAEHNLPEGATVTGDMMSTSLLSSQAGLSPVFWLNADLSIASLFFSDEWGTEQQSIADDLDLRYIYVDMRMADEMPAVGAYFFLNERSSPQQLTAGQLSKFEKTPALRLVYRHGPVSIYEVSSTAARAGQAAPTPPEGTHGWSVLFTAILGAVAGLLRRTRLRTVVGDYVRYAGIPLTAATVAAGGCVASVGLIVAGLWLSFAALLAFLGALALTSPRDWIARLRSMRPQQPVRRGIVSPPALLWAAAVVITAAAVGASVYSSWLSNVHEVNRILQSPEAFHCPGQCPTR